MHDCADPKVEFRIEGDDIDPGTLRGIANVTNSVLHDVQNPSIPYLRDISAENLVKLTRLCLAYRRMRTFGENTFMRNGGACNWSVDLICNVSGHQTELLFARDHRTEHLSGGTGCR